MATTTAETDEAEPLDRLAAVERALGRSPSDSDPEGSGIHGCVARLERTIGRAPNEATGDEGEGLCRIVAELRRAQQVSVAADGRRLVGALGLGAGTGAVVVQLVLELLGLVR